MIKTKLPMHKVRQLMTSPVKMADGGDFWDSIADTMNGLPKVAPVATGPNTSTIAPPGAATALSINPYAEPKTPSSSGTFNLASAGKVASSIAPFASNIVNSFAKPPAPHSPAYDSAVTIHAPSFNAERNQIESDTNSSSAVVARQLDGNTATKVRLFNDAQKFERLSSVNQQDHNAQLSASNDQARINAGINGRNTDRTNEYNNELTARQIAEQKQHASNLANFSDKYVGIENEKRKAQVDLDKTRTMETLFSASGVAKRVRQQLKDSGAPDPTGKNYSDLDEKAMGGIMKKKMSLGGMTTPRSFYRGIPVRAQTLRSLYKPAP